MGKEKYSTLFLFTFCGIISQAFLFLVILIFMQFNVPTWIAVIPGFAVYVVVNYKLNKKYIFVLRDNQPGQFISYIYLHGSNQLFGTRCLCIFVDYLGYNILIIQPTLSIIYYIRNRFTNDFVIFKKT